MEISLKPRGIARFFGAAFLLVWLCGWAVGETFALAMLLSGVASLLTGRPPSLGEAPVTWAVALPMGLFLLFWLTLWTLGGYLAARELLRLLSSEDRIEVGRDGLVLRRRLGPFRSTTTITRPRLLRIYGIERKCRVMAETPEGPVELSSIVPRWECETTARALRDAAGLVSDEPQVATSLPERWSEVIDAEGGAALVEDEKQRRARGRVAWGVTALCAAVAGVLTWSSPDHLDRLPLACILLALTGALAWGSWRVSYTRLEWRIDRGLLRLRRRSAQGVRELFEAQSLEIVETSDSDGDPWFTLNAVAAGAPPPSSPPAWSDRKFRRKIAHEMDDPAVPRRLGVWLAERATVPLEDRATAEHKATELNALIARLEAGGRFSRWVARHTRRS